MVFSCGEILCSLLTWVHVSVCVRLCSYACFGAFPRLPLSLSVFECMHEELHACVNEYVYVCMRE